MPLFNQIVSSALNWVTNSVPANALSTSAITLGYAQITSNFTTSSQTSVQVTGLSITVNIPAGGRYVKITGYSYSLGNSGTGGSAVEIWNGTVGSGTRLSRFDVTGSPTDIQDQGFCMIAVYIPSAGSQTFNIGALSGTASTLTLSASSTAPAFILVEAI